MTRLPVISIAEKMRNFGIVGTGTNGIQDRGFVHGSKFRGLEYNGQIVQRFQLIHLI
jgi:hypothetical protein